MHQKSKEQVHVLEYRRKEYPLPHQVGDAVESYLSPIYHTFIYCMTSCIGIKLSFKSETLSLLIIWAQTKLSTQKVLKDLEIQILAGQECRANITLRPSVSELWLQKKQETEEKRLFCSKPQWFPDTGNMMKPGDAARSFCTRHQKLPCVCSLFLSPLSIPAPSCLLPRPRPWQRLAWVDAQAFPPLHRL